MARVPKPSRPSPEVVFSPTYLYEQDDAGAPLIQRASRYEAFRRTWTGTRTPNFINLKDKGQLPENNTSSNSYWLSDYGALDSRIRTTPPAGEHSIARGVSSDFWGWFANPLADHSASARAKAEAKLRDFVSISAGAAIDLGEINQTVRMIATNVTRIAHAGLALRRGNFSGAFSALGIQPKRKFPGGPVGPRKESDPFKLLANYWLEYVYGWKPLVQDIYESIRSLEKFLEKNQWVMVARGTGKDRISSNYLYPRTVGSDGPKHIGGEVHTGMSTCKYTLYYKRDDHVKVFLAELGLTNPADLVWELLPFSFVVDWFYPIGPWLQALHAYDGLVFVKGSRVDLTTETANLEISASYNYHEPFSPFWDVLQYGSRVATRVRFDRTALTGFPTANPPVPKSPISVVHATNALALLVSVFK